MELSRAIKLIETGIESTHPSTWADLGAGSGLFTRALATLLTKGSTIYAVDTNRSGLDKIKSVDGIEMKKIIADFERVPEVKISTPLDLQHSPFDSAQGFDGILMANSLHFIKDKIAFLKKASTWLRHGGRFVIVEYNMDKPNAWVPHPISFQSCEQLSSAIGFQVRLIGEENSVYNKEGMYAAVLNK